MRMNLHVAFHLLAVFVFILNFKRCVGNAVLLAILGKGIGLVVRRRGHIKGGRAAHKYRVIGEGALYVLINCAALFPVM